MTDPNDALQQIVQSGASGDGNKALNVIITSPKIANSALREFVYQNRYTKKMSEHDILELILALDELVERKEVDSKKLEEIQKDPTILNNKD